jgi:hypothetical protein
VSDPEGPGQAVTRGAGAGSAGDGYATDPTVVAAQADSVAAAWSPAGAPASWSLTAAQFRVLSDDPELLAIAAMIELDRLPPLLFQAAATYLVLALEPPPLRDWFPRVGQSQPPLGSEFAQEYRAFCLDHRDRLLELVDRHRYQMNEVGRCADLLPALPSAAAPGRKLALVDIGTGAGLALQLDRYRYLYRAADGDEITTGDPQSSVLIETEARGTPPIPPEGTLPPIAERVGIDIEPLDLTDAEVRTWLAACIPQEIGAVTRFHEALKVALSHPVRSVRGDATAVLPDVVAAIPEDLLVCLIDSYVHVFFGDDELADFRRLVDQIGAQRDLDWASLDPLVPMGNAANRSVVGVPVPTSLIERTRSDGVFGVLGRVRYRDRARSAELLGIAHPGAAWLEWLGPVRRTGAPMR